MPLFSDYLALQSHGNSAYATPPLTTIRLDNTSAEIYKAKIIKILDLLTFYRNSAMDKILYKN